MTTNELSGQKSGDSPDERRDKSVCPECHEGALSHEPQAGSDTIPTFVCSECGYATFTREEADR
jgi:predicted RNA-binding Zn-ribbon protein involved in translation (DUF1610 family)